MIATGRWTGRNSRSTAIHDDVIKWTHFPRYWPFVRGIHQSPVNSPHKGQWRGALMFSLVCSRINGWVNNGEAGDLRRHRAHYDATVLTARPFVVTTLDRLKLLRIEVHKQWWLHSPELYFNCINWRLIHIGLATSAIIRLVSMGISRNNCHCSVS